MGEKKTCLLGGRQTLGSGNEASRPDNNLPLYGDVGPSSLKFLLSGIGFLIFIELD